MSIRGKKVIIIAHVLTTVPAEDLKKYLLDQSLDMLLVISHPLFYLEGRPGSSYLLYKKRKLIKSVQHSNRNLPSILLYIKDFFLSSYWILKHRTRWDVIIALNNLNTLTALLMRSFGRVQTVVYYTIDFVPNRFKNKILNTVYHFIDKTALNNADCIWALSNRMMTEREKMITSSSKAAPQVLVPVGIWPNRIPKIPENKRKHHTLVYAGGILPHQGIQLVLDAVPEVIKSIPDFSFLIIGVGEYEEYLKKKVKKLKIERYVSFLGYFENHKDVEEILSSCGVAVAMYSSELDKWSYYGDPSKIKSYLVTGLPVITTSVTHIAPQLDARNCGKVISYDKNELSNTIIMLMQDKKNQALMRNNAYKLAREYEWPVLFANAFKSV